MAKWLRSPAFGCPDVLATQLSSTSRYERLTRDTAQISCAEEPVKIRLTCVGSRWLTARHHHSMARNANTDRDNDKLFTSTNNNNNNQSHSKKNHTGSSLVEVNFFSLCSMTSSKNEKIEHSQTDGWSVGNVFTSDYFPYSGFLGILMVVSLGVALGVFIGGVLLVCAARVVRNKQQHTNMLPPDEFYIENQQHLTINNSILNNNNNTENVLNRENRTYDYTMHCKPIRMANVSDGNIPMLHHDAFVGTNFDSQCCDNYDQQQQHRQQQLQHKLNCNASDHYLPCKCSCFQQSSYDDKPHTTASTTTTSTQQQQKMMIQQVHQRAVATTSSPSTTMIFKNFSPTTPLTSKSYSAFSTNNKPVMSNNII
ncbi:hypothetical protein HELRODRAFT_187980 [Helobdella robusta]|uniref:Uncharacterized protein n=1 Tax=Helobdella robusta TaxID=6412 RepID=T1FPI7_HELRO|nr:hypothetical protein HELRODRAFT_187980 [Helobdella robusta]ESO12779.1 hypothetical protein HELRODRAFT_187980 [Helobdella robusta]